MTEKKCNDCGRYHVIELLTLVESEWKCYSCIKAGRGNNDEINAVHDDC